MSLVCTNLRVLSRTRRGNAHRGAATRIDRCRKPAPQGRNSTANLCCGRLSVEHRTPAADDRAREYGGAAESSGATNVRIFWLRMSTGRVSSRGVLTAGARALRRARGPAHGRTFQRRVHVLRVPTRGSKVPPLWMKLGNGKALRKPKLRS